MALKFVTRRAGAKFLGVTRYKFALIVEASGVRVRVLPGIPATYCLADLEKLDAESIRVAGREKEALAS